MYAGTRSKDGKEKEALMRPRILAEFVSLDEQRPAG